MSEQNIESLYVKQKIKKPKIEDIFFEYLNGDTKNAALDFVAYLCDKKMTPGWASANSWKCSYKGKGVCYVRANESSWSITLYGDYTKAYHDFVVSENYQDIVWNKIASKSCRRCRPHVCAPNGAAESFKGVKRTYFGKEFNNICYNGDMSFSDPDERTINYIKGVIDIKRQEIAKISF